MSKLVGLKIRLAVIVISLALYAVACTQPGAEVAFAHKQGTAIGLWLLVFGWMAGLPLMLPWLSNFLWLPGLVLLARGRLGWAMACSAAGLLIASVALLPLAWPGRGLLESKWWWLGSHAALAVGCGLAWFLRPGAGPVTMDPDFSDPIGLKPSH